MEDRFDRLEQMIGSLTTRFDSVDEQLKGVGRRFDAVDLRFDDVAQEFRDVHQRIGVLHEDVRANLRFGLEARDGLKEQMERLFAEQRDTLREELAPMKAAIRSAHDQLR